jgi:hypothetical protein
MRSLLPNKTRTCRYLMNVYIRYILLLLYLACLHNYIRVGLPLSSYDDWESAIYTYVLAANSLPYRYACLHCKLPPSLFACDSLLLAAVCSMIVSLFAMAGGFEQAIAHSQLVNSCLAIAWLGLRAGGSTSPTPL